MMMNQIPTTSITPRQCTFCDTPPEPIEVLVDDLRRYNQGAYIQVAFPEMPAERRELLMTGTHPECWDALFADEDDDA